MKWTVLGLIVVGIVAAGSAALLAVTLQANVTRQAAVSTDVQDVEILVATRDLPAMAIVDTAGVATIKVHRNEMPAKALTSTAQVIGQVLVSPVLKGQPFTGQQFATSESGVQLARALPEGSRAMSIMLSEETGIEDLLYPGSIVDVVASFHFPAANGSSSPEVVSATLLQNVHVLAVGRRSITSEQTAENAAAAASDVGNRRGRMITLMVNSVQAEALQLAVSQGAVSVALRNPLDTSQDSPQGTRLSDLSKDLAERIAALAAKESGGNGPMAPPTLAHPETQPANAEPAPPAKPAQVPAWIITILRNGHPRETQEFPQPEKDTQF